MFNDNDVDVTILYLQKLSYLQLHAGTSYHYLESCPRYMPHVPETWLGCLRAFLATFHSTIKIQDAWLPQKQRQNDTFIMDDVLLISDAEVCHVNYCRLYLKVQFLSNIADPTGKKIQACYLQDARAVDPTMVKALGSLAMQQTEATDTTVKRMTQLLNYAASHPDATIRYTKSGMILHISSDASYLSKPKARSCVGGHFFLADQPPPNGIPEPKLNGPVHTVSNILRNVMSSAGKAEVAGLFHNLKDGVMLRNALIEMGHPQPATPVQTDNSFAEGFANQTVKQRRSKAIDMRFYWVQDRVAQRQFHIYWQKGATNLADYFTKHHPAHHHRFMRNNYLLDLHRANFADIIFVN